MVTIIIKEPFEADNSDNTRKEGDASKGEGIRKFQMIVKKVIQKNRALAAQERRKIQLQQSAAINETECSQKMDSCWKRAFG